MSRENIRAGDGAITEGGCIVVFHRGLIVGIVVVNEGDFFDGVADQIKAIKNIQNKVSDLFVDDQLPLVGETIETDMENLQIAKRFQRNGTVFRIRKAADAIFDFCCDRGNGEAACGSIGSDSYCRTAMVVIQCIQT